MQMNKWLALKSMFEYHLFFFFPVKNWALSECCKPCSDVCLTGGKQCTCNDSKDCPSKSQTGWVWCCITQFQKACLTRLFLFFLSECCKPCSDLCLTGDKQCTSKDCPPVTNGMGLVFYHSIPTIFLRARNGGCKSSVFLSHAQQYDWLSIADCGLLDTSLVHNANSNTVSLKNFL